MSTRLGTEQRDTALARMRGEEFDVLVIGGGVTGCGAALDAVTRGLSVALVEMQDYAAGTSSRSGKLIHGGLRYLEQLNFALVAEALRERALMLRTLCPHLVRPVRFVYPLTHRVWERGYVGAGTLLYDAIGGAGAVPRHRHLSKRNTAALAPSLRQDTLAGAITFYDAQVDDARHTMMLARTAAGYGAAVASSAKVVNLLGSSGRVTGARVWDTETGDEFDVRARQVIAATGVWTDEITEFSGGRSGITVRASKGVHIMVPRARISSDAAILVRAEDSVLFIRPWGRHWLIGTTDTAYDADLDDPAATTEDVDYLLRNVNRVIEPALSRSDVVGVFAGLRPLISVQKTSGDKGTTSKLSREHAVTSPVPGLTLVTGGKYTTYRVMAADAVDAAVAAPASGTKEVPLLGADGYRALWNSRQRLASRSGFDVSRIEHLIGRYGSLTHEVLDLAGQRPELAKPVPGAEKYLLAEAYYAASHEGALHLRDVLCRRTHIAIEAADGGEQAAPHVASVVGAALGWDSATVARELGQYLSQARAERVSAGLTVASGDADARAVRGG